MIIVKPRDKKELEILLEKYAVPISRPKRQLEQYATPPEIAAHIVWTAYMRGDIQSKDILDPGCGSLSLGLAACFLGGKRIVGFDIDPDPLWDALKVAENLCEGRIMLVNMDIDSTAIIGVDTVLMNPPFGVYRRNRGMDILFLNKVLLIGPKRIYTIHKHSPGLDELIPKVSEARGYRVIHREILEFPIKALFETHRRKIYRVRTVFYILDKQTVNK